MVRMSDDIEHLDFMPQGFKQLPCKYCDKPMVVGDRTRKLPHHIECSMRVAMENVRQISSKSGPYYERWRAGMAMWAKNQEGGGLPPSEEG